MPSSVGSPTAADAKISEATGTRAVRPKMLMNRVPRSSGSIGSLSPIAMATATPAAPIRPSAINRPLVARLLSMRR